ncbi:MAG TPA: hypothetical protein VNA12_10595 [Mycobacteriales bacterium]|nr:hypothetical protein [Mycobacteriales bacterium]
MANPAAVVRRPMPEGAVAVAAAALTGAGAAVGRPALVGVVVIAQLGVAAGVLLLADAPAFRDSFVIAALAALAADAVAVWDDGAHVGALVGVVALGVAAAFVAELVRTDRERVVESIAATTSAVVLVVCAAHLLVVGGTSFGQQVVSVALGAVAVGVLAGRLADAVHRGPVAIPGGRRGLVAVVVGLAAGTAGGAALGTPVDLLGTGRGALLGLAVALAAMTADLATDVAAADVDARRALAAPLAAVLPIVLAAPVVYGMARLLFA